MLKLVAHSRSLGYEPTCTEQLRPTRIHSTRCSSRFSTTHPDPDPPQNHYRLSANCQPNKPGFGRAHPAPSILSSSSLSQRSDVSSQDGASIFDVLVCAISARGDVRSKSPQEAASSQFTAVEDAKQNETVAIVAVLEDVRRADHFQDELPVLFTSRERPAKLRM